jgi:hypothetical protein
VYLLDYIYTTRYTVHTTSTHSEPRQRMHVSVQLQTLASHWKKKQPCNTHQIWGWVGPLASTATGRRESLSLSLQGSEFPLSVHKQNVAILPSGYSITLSNTNRRKHSSKVRQLIRHSWINGFYLHGKHRNRTCNCRKLKWLLATKTQTHLCSEWSLMTKTTKRCCLIFED